MGKHLVYRQILEITFPSKKEAMDGQNTLSRLYHRDLILLINEVFDELVPANRHLRLERLEVNLGHLNPNSIENDFQHRLRSQLEDDLSKKLQEAHLLHHRNGERSTPGASTLETPFTDEAKAHSPESRALELFSFFVKTGQLPWWAGREEFKSLEVIVSSLIENQPERLLSQLHKLLQSATYCRRIIHQFTDRILGKFIALKLNSGPKSTFLDRIIALYEDLYHIQSRKPFVSLTRSNLRLFLWQVAFNYWLLNHNAASGATFNPQITTAEIPGKPFELIPKSYFESYFLALLQALTENNDPQDIPSEGGVTNKRVIQLISRLLREVDELGIQHRVLGKTIAALTKRSDQALRQMFSKLQDQQHVAKKREQSETEQQEGTKLLLDQDYFEIQNAGMVIIAPFLPRFFDALWLVSEKEFVTDEAAIRGALLLQYIVTAQTEMPEHELILNKILCGLPVDEPLPRSLEISDREQEECEYLLQSVLEHWEALKSTSVGGLRQTFLIKDGLLSIEGNGWKLRVERDTVDILLDRLPWGISIIKLPWNDEILHVEW